MDKVRFGIIGAGKILEHVAGVFRDDETIEPVAIADVNLLAARRLARDMKVEHVYHDYRRILERGDVDAVYVATPPHLHRSMVLDAVQAEMHVICEKPFMLNAAEVTEVLAAADERPYLKVGCCSSRFHDAATARRARQMVGTGELGRVYRLWFESVSAARAPGASLPDWRNNPAQNGGGIGFDWGVYDLDWISYVLADRVVPRVVFATMDNYFPVTRQRRPPQPDVDGRLAAEMICDGGLTIHWERRAGEHGPPRERAEIRGTRAGIDLAMTSHGTPNGLVRHAYIGEADLVSNSQSEAGPQWGGTLVYPIRDLKAAILEDREPASPPRRQLFIHTVLDAVYASAKSKTSILVDFGGKGAGS